MSFPKYGAYKESGVEWLGTVPQHWNRVRLRHVAVLNPSKSEVNELNKEQLVSFLPMEAIGDDGTINIEQTRPIKAVESGYTYFRENDVTLAKITPCFENGKGAIMKGLLNGIGFGTTELIVVRPIKEKTSSEYLHWLFLSTYFRKIGESTMYGAGGQKRVPDEFVRNFSIEIPPPEEQTAIANFLDAETSKIDALVAEQRRLIELLKEKRQAVISHAVTKGLNPNAPMKDSGIEWLGEVPEHWEVTRLSYFATVENGSTPSRDNLDYWDDGTVPWVSSGEVNQSRIKEPSALITEKALLDCPIRLLPVGTVVVGMIGQGKTRGLGALLEIEATINQNLAAIVCGNQLEPEYLHLLFQAAYVFLREFGRGGNQAAMNCEILRAMRIPMPSVKEQKEIIHYVDQALQAIDHLSAEADKAIELLRERRTALISAAVTGKFDVRKAVKQIAYSGS